MRFSLAVTVDRRLKKLKRTQPQTFRKIRKQLLLFRQDHTHPSLRHHKLKGNLKETWSISIERNMRMVYYISSGQAVFFLIGSHDEVYRDTKSS